MPRKKIEVKVQEGQPEFGSPEFIKRGQEARVEKLKDPAYRKEILARRAIKKAMKPFLREYKDNLEKRLDRLDKVYDRIEAEIMDVPPGELKAAQLDILLRYARQVHELFIGRPKAHIESKGTGNVTVVINEEPEININPPILEQSNVQFIEGEVTEVIEEAGC